MHSHDNIFPTASGSILPPLNLRKARNWFIRSKTEFCKIEPDSEFVVALPLIEQNWLIPSHVMIGGYPASFTGNVSQSNDILKSLVQVEGIHTFVCLNEEYGRNIIHPAYADDTSKFCFGKQNIKAYKSDFDKIQNFIHLPITDMSVTDKSRVVELCKTIISHLENGEKIYIHCSGGHGRSGTIASVLLCMIYGINIEIAFEYIQYAHDQRIRANIDGGCYSRFLTGIDRPLIRALQRGQVPSPQTSVQRNQAREIVKVLT